MMFKVGDKVKLRNGQYEDLKHSLNVDIEYDKIYTIKDIEDVYISLKESKQCWFLHRFEKVENDMINDDREHFRNTVRWLKKAYEEIYKAGGHPPSVLNNVSEDFLMSMITNNLMIVYSPENKEKN